MVALVANTIFVMTRVLDAAPMCKAEEVNISLQYWYNNVTCVHRIILVYRVFRNEGKLFLMNNE